MSVSCEHCVLSGRGFCVGLMPRPESPTDCGVSECDREASIMWRPWPPLKVVASCAGGGNS
jgi:hypothetical protein